MAIYVNLNIVMAHRRISSQELAEQVGITQANLSILKTGKAKAIRFSTLDAICKASLGTFWNTERRNLCEIQSL